MDVGYVGAFLGGLLSLLSPCSVMLLPAFFAYAFTSPATLMSRTGIFALGLLATLVPLGVFSGAFGSLLGEHRGVLITSVAVIVMLVGVLQLSGLPIPGITRSGKAQADGSSAVAVFLLGAVYAVAGVCTGPILGSVLMLASLGGSPLYGALLLAVYAAGMVLPLVVLTLLWRHFGAAAMRWVRPRILRIGRWENSWTNVITGSLSLALGIILLVTDGTANLGGFLAVGTQFDIESRVSLFAAEVPDWVFIAGAVIVLLAVATVALIRRSRSVRSE